MFKNLNTGSNEKSNSKPAKNNLNVLMPSVNMISEGTSIEGSIESDTDIRIDGKLIGNIKSSAKVVIGSTGVVEGEIECASADVLGKISGTIEVKELLFLKNSAVIIGDIFTEKMIVETGAVFNGNCTMGGYKEELSKIKQDAKIAGVRKEATVR